MRHKRLQGFYDLFASHLLIRTDFVTNSSSGSFIIARDEELRETLWKEMEKASEDEFIVIDGDLSY